MSKCLNCLRFFKEILLPLIMLSWVLYLLNHAVYSRADSFTVMSIAATLIVLCAVFYVQSFKLGSKKGAGSGGGSMTEIEMNCLRLLDFCLKKSSIEFIINILHIVLVSLDKRIQEVDIDELGKIKEEVEELERKRNPRKETKRLL